MAKYTVKDKPLLCPVCQHDDFHWHQGLKESRLSSFMGFDWAKAGVDKLSCGECSHTMTFTRGPAPHRPQAKNR